MSLYHVTIGKNEYHVNLNGKQATVDGTPVPGSTQLLNGSGLHLLRRGLQAGLFINSQDYATLEVLAGSRRMLARVETHQHHQNIKKTSASTGSLIAPMPGMVVGIQISEGQQVQEGQTLVIMESMKMQMQLRSPCNGIVRTVTVHPGSQVEKGTVMVHIDPQG